MPELLAGPYCHGARRPNNRPAKGPRAQKEFVHVIWGTSFVCWESVLFFPLFFLWRCCYLFYSAKSGTCYNGDGLTFHCVRGYNGRSLLLCCKGEFILAKHREKEKEKCFCMCARVSVLGLLHKWIFIACYVRRWQKRLVFDDFYDIFFFFDFFIFRNSRTV